ncbi:putative phospholipid import ATP-binding protein MlaF [bacterium BMS3Abin05]|nr:putative phospholipid import ATP-binding protein MlaF [bacterium BMS3Abin05]GBE26515.1 putative phospholipid import ATP-binding protein MlaF [bacterium BMS3Bbin03]HDK36505.1 ABC transporter ATP-binding protein [Bacteroidota bacterium]HDL78148.1 ABC transporter ATP-binding protein [Bacteroidota bacterium]HDZ11048.1 ABC transporter ATP-binding protein [Bacteroidota bacterium]
MADFIVFKNVHKSFDDHHVLKGINLTVFTGETIVILGGSGAGKSVLLRLINGLLRPNRGHIYVEGYDITEFSEEELIPIRTTVGMVFQGGALFDSLTVFENVAYALREHTQMTEKEIAQRVRKMLRLVGLENAEEMMPSDLSGGMMKRVSLARSLAIEPKGLLYDEPTTGLDPIIAKKINTMIRNLQKILGVTSIVVTHDIKSAFTVADRIALLYKGKIHFVGTVEETRTTDDPIVQEFIES